MTTKLAQLIAREEGFGIPGALPTRNDNPGDLRHAPGELHTAAAPDAVGSFPSAADGWQELERQLGLYAERGLTLRQTIYEFAPPNENDTAAYLQFVCNGLGCEPDILVSEALTLGGGSLA